MEREQENDIVPYVFLDELRNQLILTGSKEVDLNEIREFFDRYDRPEETQSENSEPVKAITYYVGDFLNHSDDIDNTEQMERLAEWIKKQVAPGSWDSAGGTGKIDFYSNNHALVIATQDVIHNKILTALERLRFARDLTASPKQESEDLHGE